MPDVCIPNEQIAMVQVEQLENQLRAKDGVANKPGSGGGGAQTRVTTCDFKKIWKNAMKQEGRWEADR